MGAGVQKIIYLLAACSSGLIGTWCQTVDFLQDKEKGHRQVISALFFILCCAVKKKRPACLTL